MKKNNNIKLLEGGLVGAVLGVAAGLLLAPKTGKKMQEDIKKVSANFYNYIAPKIKKMKHVGEKEYNALVSKSAETYAKAKKLSLDQQKAIVLEAKKSWKHLHKHLSKQTKTKK